MLVELSTNIILIKKILSINVFHALAITTFERCLLIHEAETL